MNETFLNPVYEIRRQLKLTIVYHRGLTHFVLEKNCLPYKLVSNQDPVTPGE